MRKIIIILLNIIILSGCKPVELLDGRIPISYLKIANYYAGTYTGQFNNRQIELTLTLEENLVKLSSNQDLIANHCFSQFGDLKQVYVEIDNYDYYVKEAEFEFNPNHCNKKYPSVKSLKLYIEKVNNNLKLFTLLIDKDHNIISGEFIKNP